jgi:hypothetical protein
MSGRDLKRIEVVTEVLAGRRTVVSAAGCVSAKCAAHLSIIGEVTSCHIPVQRSRTAYLLLRFGAGPVDSRTTRVVFTLYCSP